MIALFNLVKELRHELQTMRAELDDMKAQFKKNDLLTRVAALENKGRPST